MGVCENTVISMFVLFESKTFLKFFIEPVHFSRCRPSAFIRDNTYRSPVFSTKVSKRFRLYACRRNPLFIDIGNQTLWQLRSLCEHFFWFQGSATCQNFIILKYYTIAISIHCSRDSRSHLKLCRERYRHFLFTLQHKQPLNTT